MNLTVVDAFTDKPFSGNPAAVAVVPEFPPDEAMQAIAAEMALSETAFVVPREGYRYAMRWFTPTVEVPLCGHATLAAAHVLAHDATFETASGPLVCRIRDRLIEMDFPARYSVTRPLPSTPPGLTNVRWSGVAGDSWIVELDAPAQVVGLEPDLSAIAALGKRALIVTARAERTAAFDIVSRVFAPNVGIPEDPVTGSAHCALAPYWAKRLGRDEIVGWQASWRGGTVWMRIAADRVILSGSAVTVAHVDLLAEPQKTAPPRPDVTLTGS